MNAEATETNGGDDRRAAWIILTVLCIVGGVLAIVRATSTFSSFDQTYFLQATYRILEGQVPHRDFILVVTPGHYYWHALWWWIFGPTQYTTLANQVFVTSATILLTYALLRHLWGRPRWSALFCIPAALGGYWIWPHPFYDNDAVLVMLACLWLYTRSEDTGAHPVWAFAMGVTSILAWFMKQNLGIAFGVCIHGLMVFQILLDRRPEMLRRYAWFAAGAATTVAGLLGFLSATGALGKLWEQTILYAASARLTLSPVDALTVPFTFPKGHFNLNDPFGAKRLIWGLHNVVLLLITLFAFRLVPNGGARRLEFVLPWCLLAIVVGAYQSQRLESTYALWWMLGLTAVLTLRAARPGPYATGGLAAAVILGSALPGAYVFYYGWTGDRIDFYGRDPFENNVPFRTKNLRPLRGKEPYTPAFDTLVEYVRDNLPPDANVMILPTEGAIALALERPPRHRVLQWHVIAGGTLEATLEDLWEDRVDYVAIAKRWEYDGMLGPEPIVDWLEHGHGKLVADLPNHRVFKVVDRTRDDGVDWLKKWRIVDVRRNQ